MRELTTERLRQVLQYDAATGKFTWLAGARTGKAAGSVNTLGYVQIGIDGTTQYAHRLAWLYVHGEWPHAEIDHRNGVKSDNRIDNLRDTTRTENSENVRRAHRDSKSGLLGASWSKDKGRWYSRIRASGQTRFLGYFTQPEAAHAAYLAAKRESHKGNTL